jgi:hypothetical protein
MPEAAVVETEVTPQTSEPVPAPEVTESDIDKMTPAQLEEFVKKDYPPDPAAKDKGPAQTKDPAKAPDDTKWVEIEVDEGSKLRFRNDDELKKSYVHAQRLIKTQKATIDKYNAERGTLGKEKTELETLKQQNQQYQQYIQQLQAGAGQMAAGQTPNAATQSALSALMPNAQGQDPQNVLWQEIVNLKNGFQNLQAEYQQSIQGLKAKEQEALVNQGVQSLYNEVSKFADKHPEYKTDEDFAKVDDIVSTYGEDIAKTMVSPSDYEKYTAVMDLVALYKNDPTGKFELNRKNYQDLEESFLIHSHRTGTLATALANAQKAGMTSYEGALTKAQNAAVKIGRASCRERV